MNAPTAMLLAAAGFSGYVETDWVGVELSMMDSTLPWRDPDGAFVGLSTTGPTWTITVNYNGAGSINDGFAEVIAWKSANLGAVIPARASEQWNNAQFFEHVTILSAIPADTAAWQPITIIGRLANNDATTGLGGGNRCSSATQSGVCVNNDTSAAFGPVTTATTAAKGAVWNFFPGRGGATNTLHQTNGTVVTGGSTSLASTSSLTVTSSQFVLGFGNATSSPAAGNRQVTVSFYVRVLSLPIVSIAASVDATGWTRGSPLDFGTPGSPASDPNALLSSFDTSVAPIWAPTINDTGKGGQFDGYTEGIRWDAPTSPVPFDGPIFFSFETITNSAYAATQQFGFAAGVADPTGTGSEMPGFKYQTASTTRTSQVVEFNTNQNGSAVANALNTSGLYYPAADGTTTGGIIGQSVQLVTGAVPSGTVAILDRANALSAPTFSVSMNKDSAIVGSAAVELRFNFWYVVVPGYTNNWPP